MSLLRTAGSLLGVVAFLLLVLTPSALGAPAQPACPVAAAPGPPVDASEVPLPGQAEPPPLPVPDPPVGGPGMGTCGVVSPDGVAPPPPVDVESYVLADLDTGEVLAAKLPHARLRPASLLKTLTGLLVARQVPMDEVITATQADADQEARGSASARAGSTPRANSSTACSCSRATTSPTPSPSASPAASRGPSRR